jgi:type II secretory pathway pseudopilin PulG
MNETFKCTSTREAGFSLVELIISLVICLIIMGGAVAIYTKSLSTRSRESGRVDAITSAQAALSVMSREIGNSGYGLFQNNGLVLADCGEKKIRFRTNVNNNDYQTSSPGEDVMYLYDGGSQSVVRFDMHPVAGADNPSGIINQISDVDFLYHQYTTLGGYLGGSTTPTADTGRVTINLYVKLPDVAGQPTGRIEKVSSDVTLRNASYHLNQY